MPRKAPCRADNVSFCDGHPVPVVDFDYPPEGNADNHAQDGDALEALRHGLLVVIADGHADGARIRAVALARLIGLYESNAAASVSTGVNRSTLHRAVLRMKEKIKGSLCATKVPDKKPVNKRDSRGA